MRKWCCFSPVKLVLFQNRVAQLRIMAEQPEKRKNNISTRALGCIRIEGSQHRCYIDPLSGCSYYQDRLELGNFIRHFRTKHEIAAHRFQLIGKIEFPLKKSRVVPKVPVAIDKALYLQFCIKSVTQHQLPLCFLEWEGFRLILDPLAEALKFRINRHNINNHLRIGANKIKEAISAEMRGKMVSIMIDSASSHSRHIICLQAQYESGGEVCIRTLGMSYFLSFLTK